MEPVLMILFFALPGGLVLAWLIAHNRRDGAVTFVPRELAAPSPTLINMAQIKVEGIGGLGMVAAVVVVALTDPRIRVAILLAAVLGIGLALCLIWLRRRASERPSDGNPPPLRIDGEPNRAAYAAARPVNHRTDSAGRLRLA